MRAFGVRSSLVIVVALVALRPAPSSAPLAAMQLAPDIIGSVTGVFVNPEPPDASVTGQGTSHIRWGIGAQSSLTFVGNPFFVKFDEVFPLGAITFSNAASEGGVIGYIDMRVTVSLTLPETLSQSFAWTMPVHNTTNVPNDPEASADSVHLPYFYPSSFFELDGVRYTLNVIGFGAADGNPAHQTRSLHAREGAQFTTLLYGSISFACVFSTSAPLREQVGGFPNCGASTPVDLSPTWGRFGQRAVLEADSGDRLNLKCEEGEYRLYYTRRGGAPLRVGVCPFQGGCNSVEFYHSGDTNANGKPDCFTRTLWNSADYDVNDNTWNPWTGEIEPTENLLDWAVSIYHVNSNYLDKKSYKWEYAYGPPIPFSHCQQPQGIPELALVSVTSVDPPLGPQTEAFFDDVSARRATLPGLSVPMSGQIWKRCDFDGDGDCDGADRTRFEAAFGLCEWNEGYDPRGDVDKSACIDVTDRSYLFELDEDSDGVKDSADNCPAFANPDQADWDRNGLGDVCDVPALEGDLDRDGDVDRHDLTTLLAGRNTKASSPKDPRDLDRDGQITALDGRRLTLRCTRPGCAVQ